MKYIALNGTNYGFAIDFKHNQDIRTSFNKLTAATFGFSLESWYQDGFWGDYYIPYSLLHNGEVVSNVSISKIEFDIEKERKTGIQIGTVMTSEKYRHRGLSKFLIEHVINKWKGQSDFIYLFANDSVLDFYPKFNFEVIEEYQPYKSVDTHHSKSSLRRLNIEDKTDRALLIETVNMSVPISKVSMRNNLSLTMFYCTSYKKNSIYYIEALRAIAIADFEGDTLFLHDVFSKDLIELNELIPFLSDDKTKKVILGFTPLNEMEFDKHLLMGEDTLFMLKNGIGYFKNKHWMFPVLSHA